MTEIETIRHIKTTKTFPKTFDDYSNYFTFIFSLAFIAIGGSMIYNYFKFDNGLTVLVVSILFISAGIFFSFFTYKRLNENVTFEIVSTSTNIDIDKITDRLEQNFKLSKINVNRDLGKIEAFTKMTAFSWGEKLTLIWNEDEILVNSRPSGSLQPFTIVKDRRNIKKVEQLLY